MIIAWWLVMALVASNSLYFPFSGRTLNEGVVMGIVDAVLFMIAVKVIGYLISQKRKRIIRNGS